MKFLIDKNISPLVSKKATMAKTSWGICTSKGHLPGFEGQGAVRDSN